MEIVPHVFKMADIDIIMVTCINTKLMQFSYIRFKMAANGPICIPFHSHNGQNKSLADSLFLSYWIYSAEWLVGV